MTSISRQPPPQLLKTEREKYLETLTRWLSIDDTQAVDIIMATAVSVALPGDPVWLFVIGPPGGSKTEILRAYSGDLIYSISTVTPQTLISGLKGSKNTDLLPELDGKILIIKDFTSILAKKAEDQAAIFADFREAYDGRLEKAFGSGVGTKRYESNFGLIAGVTGAIDMHRIVHSQLGERFLKCRLKNNPEAAIDRAGDLTGKEEEMRPDIEQATGACLSYYTQCATENPSFTVAEEVKSRIKALANITAKLRSEVARDRYHKVLYHPQPEVGTRLAKQFIKLGQSLCILFEHDKIGDEEYQLLLRLAEDGVPEQKMRLIPALLNEEPMTTKEAGERATIPTDTAKDLLEDLWMLGMVERSGDNVFYWQLKENTTNLLLLSGLGTQNTLCKHENK